MRSTSIARPSSGSRYAAREDLRKTSEAILDTGFTGALTLPSNLISTLRLPFRRKGRALLADGSESVFNTYEATVMWDGQPRHISIDAADTDPLLGMALLYNHEVRIQVVAGGAVLIRTMVQA